MHVVSAGPPVGERDLRGSVQELHGSREEGVTKMDGG